MAGVLLAVLILLPAVLTFVLRSNAAMSFLALCGGFAVITLSGSDIEHLVGKTRITSFTSNDIDLILLLAPLLFTLLFTFRAVISKKLRIAQLLPALAAGALLASVAAPMFGDVVNANFSDLSFWRSLQDAQAYIVSGGLLVSLFLIWTGGFIHAKSHGKKHK
jgi:hypothetical protein